MSVSELSRGRPAAAERSNKAGLFARLGSVFTTVRSSLGKLVSFVFTRALLMLLIGFAAGMAWMSYGYAVRTAVAGWSPHLAWIAPAASAGSSRDRIRATSQALAAVRQSVDKLATEVDRLQLQEPAAGDQRSATRRASQRR